jgi:hypothetical protein
MQPQTTQLFENLDQHRTNLRTTVGEIPPELRRQRPAPERWSVIEILEHLGLVERRLTSLFSQWMAEACEQGLHPEEVPAPEINMEIVLDRSRQIVAGASAQPRAGLDEAAAWAVLDEARRDLKTTVQVGEGLPLGGVIRPHPALGPLNFYQWVEFVGWHEARHTAQIRENGSLLGAPPGRQ